ncbi:MAG: iron-containing alcohol dehydrogenase [Chloroflexi bacterium]|nr:iron-containing alcohol dehydrogenase [Chloroflexota bacterium]MCI0575698.1 iron-containing alcohol dehydrogenase [Chloroflexota bacterium]MCI0648040.1 iron-containing alcohol dehydrogenase [Chloroflexota bacterium]MCI0726474.1 iron-containing alcohol dehydrogenase [Chloroflexota bacterium]
MWQFQSPEIIFGEDALSWLDSLQGRRAYLITDANMVRLGFAQRIQDQLAAAGLESRVFGEVEPDPSIQTVRRATSALLDYEPDVVIGLGGGSCLDAAKAAWFLYERPDVALEEINPFQPFETGKARLIAIPTTSGTGADATIGVVLTDAEQQRKLVIYARELQPAVTIVDPSLVLGLPPQITADTGMDVLSHSIEAFAGPWHNDFTDGLCLKATELVFTYLPRAYADGSDAEAREHMHNAATMAGVGLSNASIALAHALAHAFGAVFHTPHGRTVGMFLPYSLEYTATGGGTRYAELAAFLRLPAAGEVEGTASLVAAIRALARQVNQPTSIQEMGIDQAAFDQALSQLVAKAAEDPQMLTTLRVPSDDDLAQLFRYAYEGHTVNF